MALPQWLTDHNYPLGEQVSVTYCSPNDEPQTVVGVELDTEDAFGEEFLTIVLLMVEYEHDGRPRFKTIEHPEGKASILRINKRYIVTTSTTLHEPEQENS